MIDKRPPIRTCLSCKSCEIELDSPAYSEVTPGDPESIRCLSGHWDITNRLSRKNLSDVIFMAGNCPDYDAQVWA